MEKDSSNAGEVGLENPEWQHTRWQQENRSLIFGACVPLPVIKVTRYRKQWTLGGQVAYLLQVAP
jgi:hypothetical protein